MVPHKPSTGSYLEMRLMSSLDRDIAIMGGRRWSPAWSILNEDRVYQTLQPEVNWDWNTNPIENNKEPLFTCTKRTSVHKTKRLSPKHFLPNDMQACMTLVHSMAF